METNAERVGVTVLGMMHLMGVTLVGGIALWGRLSIFRICYSYDSHRTCLSVLVVTTLDFLGYLLDRMSLVVVYSCAIEPIDTFVPEDLCPFRRSRSFAVMFFVVACSFAWEWSTARGHSCVDNGDLGAHSEQ